MYKLCHTEASSRRQREIEQGLLSAMSSQPYGKITLTELCRQLKLPRKTFYRYFPTKEACLLALIDHTLADCNDVALKGWDGSKALDQTVQQRFFGYWQGQKPFLDAMEENGFRDLLLQRTTRIVDKMKKGAVSDGFARDEVEYFIAHGLMMTVLRWHHFGYRSTPEEMAKVFGGILRSEELSITRLLL